MKPLQADKASALLSSTFINYWQSDYVLSESPIYIKNIKKRVTYIVEHNQNTSLPEPDGNSWCFALSTDIVLGLLWVRVDCYHQLADMYYICEAANTTKQSTVNNIYKKLTKNNRYCLYSYIFMFNLCWKIRKYPTPFLNQTIPEIAYQFLASWTIGNPNRKTLGIVNDEKANDIQCLNRQSDVKVYLIKWSQNSCKIKSTRYYITQKLPVPRSKPTGCGTRYFTCRNMECLLNVYVCDGVKHCISDETSCKPVCSMKSNCRTDCQYEQCECGLLHFQCFSGGCVPLQFLCDRKADCQDNSDEQQCLKQRTIASEDLMLPPSTVQLPASSTDCPDGWALCTDSNEMVCYPIHKWCVYQTYLGTTLYCPALEQTYFCYNFECPTMFKCHYTYCIPTYMVCDGVYDCPSAEDELSCGALACPGLLRCTLDNRCVHPVDVCDGVINCLHSRDDEIYCDVMRCPDDCSCVGYLVYCNTTLPRASNIPAVINTLIFYTLFIPAVYSPNHLTNLNVFIFDNGAFLAGTLNRYIFSNLTNLSNITLHFCKIVVIQRGTFKDLSQLHSIQLNGNYLTTIYTHTFEGLSSLPMLNLYNLGIFVLRPCSFCQANQLSLLNLSHNHISTIYRYTFHQLSNLSIVDLCYNPIVHIDADFECGHTENVFLFHEPVYCCYSAKPSLCLSLNHFQTVPFYCKTIMSSQVLIIQNAAVTFVIFIINLVILVHEGKLQSTGKAHAYFAKQIAILDSLSLIYAFLLSLSAFIYYNNFFYVGTHWRYSFLCKFSEKVALFSFITSKFTVLTSVFNQVLGTKYALKRQPLTNTKSKRIVAIICLSTALVLLCDLLWNWDDPPSITCFPLSHKLRTFPSRTMFTVYLAITFIVTITIAVLYRSIMIAVEQSTVKFKSRSEAKRMRVKLMKKIVPLILIELLTWSQFFIVSCLAQFAHKKMSDNLLTILQLVTVYVSSSVHTFSRILVM